MESRKDLIAALEDCIDFAKDNIDFSSPVQLLKYHQAIKTLRYAQLQLDQDQWSELRAPRVNYFDAMRQ